ncbi:MAG: polymorphic toxin type 5 domain-containing protein [Acetobacteraceae bacterium]
MARQQRTGAEAAFMRWARMQIIASGETHPLAFLIDWTRKDWHARKGSRRADAVVNEDFPPVQAGHLTSFHALAVERTSERLALEDADFNQEKNYSIESRGAYAMTTAIDIGGLPVEASTAAMWGRLGLLEREILRAARPHPGWAKI